jgi:hypothetical protein
MRFENAIVVIHIVLSNDWLKAIEEKKIGWNSNSTKLVLIWD